MEIHSPDIVGPVALATLPGVAGQVLTSAGPGAQAVWSTPVSAGVKFPYTSASATSHVINHSLNNMYPVVSVYDSGTGAVIIPVSIVGTTLNQTTITLFTARAIAGTIIG